MNLEWDVPKDGIEKVNLYLYAKNGIERVKLYQFAKYGIAKVEIYLFTDVVCNDWI